MPLDIRFTLPTVDVLAEVPWTEAVRLTTFIAQITAFSGPYGLFARKDGLFGVEYGGKLNYGNHFGTCEVGVTGQYVNIVDAFFNFAEALGDAMAGRQRRPGRSGTFVARSTIAISPPAPPVFSPPGLTIKAGRPGPPGNVQVGVTPPGRYQINFASGDPALALVPSLLHTDANGNGTVSVRDLLGEPRSLIVTATITPHLPCVGNPVEATLPVNVVAP